MWDVAISYHCGKCRRELLVKIIKWTNFGHCWQVALLPLESGDAGRSKQMALHPDNAAGE